MTMPSSGIRCNGTGGPNILCFMNWFICLCSPASHSFQVESFFNFLQVKYPIASSSGVILLDKRVLMQTLINLSSNASSNKTRSSFRITTMLHISSKDKVAIYPSQSLHSRSVGAKLLR